MAKASEGEPVWYGIPESSIRVSPAFLDEPESGTAVNATEFEVRRGLAVNDPVYQELLGETRRRGQDWIINNRSAASLLEVLLD